jgi:hypothetical protein
LGGVLIYLKSLIWKLLLLLVVWIVLILMLVVMILLRRSLMYVVVLELLFRDDENLEIIRLYGPSSDLVFDLVMQEGVHLLLTSEELLQPCRPGGHG